MKMIAEYIRKSKTILVFLLALGSYYMFVTEKSMKLIFLALFFLFVAIFNFMLNKSDRLRRNKLTNETNADKFDDYERFIIVNQTNIIKNIIAELTIYQQFISDSQKNATIKTAVFKGMTIIWFFNKKEFVMFFEIFSSLSESFTGNTMAVLLNDKDNIIIYDNKIKDQYDKLPAIDTNDKTYSIHYDKDDVVLKDSLMRKKLKVPFEKEVVIRNIRELDILHLDYKIVTISPNS